jgi:hypothetical protein
VGAGTGPRLPIDPHRQLPGEGLPPADGHLAVGKGHLLHLLGLGRLHRDRRDLPVVAWIASRIPSTASGMSDSGLYPCAGRLGLHPQDRVDVIDPATYRVVGQLRVGGIDRGF